MKLFFLYLMSVLYMVAGIYHFVNPRFYLRMMPPWIPLHKQAVQISGILEIVLGVLLLFGDTRIAAAWGIMILLVLIFPANIQMALNFYRKKHRLLWVAIVRLPLQILLIWWAWQYT